MIVPESKYLHVMKLPRTFVEDHFLRDLDTGENPQWINARQVLVHCDDDALEEIYDDAKYYSHDVDMAPPNIIASARRVVAAIEKYRATRLGQPR